MTSSRETCTTIVRIRALGRLAWNEMLLRLCLGSRNPVENHAALESNEARVHSRPEHFVIFALSMASLAGVILTFAAIIVNSLKPWLLSITLSMGLPTDSTYGMEQARAFIAHWFGSASPEQVVFWLCVVLVTVSLLGALSASRRTIFSFAWPESSVACEQISTPAFNHCLSNITTRDAVRLELSCRLRLAEHPDTSTTRALRPSSVRLSRRSGRSASWFDELAFGAELSGCASLVTWAIAYFADRFASSRRPSRNARVTFVPTQEGSVRFGWSMPSVANRLRFGVSKASGPQPRSRLAAPILPRF